jgi:tetratricopeptide (TPR) repeat protein
MCYNLFKIFCTKDAFTRRTETERMRKMSGIAVSLNDKPPASPAKINPLAGWKQYILVAGFILAGSILEPFIFGPGSRLWHYLLSAAFLLFVAKVLLWDHRAHDPINRRYDLLAALPISLGVTAFLLTGRFAYALLAVLWVMLLVAWARYLRYPSETWPALRMLRSRNYPGALQHIHEVINTQPADWRYYRVRESIHLASHHLWEAEQDARRVVRYHPGAKAHQDLAAILVYMARFEDARVEYQRALRQEPASALAQYGLGLACYRLERYPEAVQALGMATRTTLPYLRQNLLAYYYLARSLEAVGQGEQAQTALHAMRRYSRGREKLAQFIQANLAFPGTASLVRDLVGIDLRLEDQRLFAANPFQEYGG